MEPADDRAPLTRAIAPVVFALLVLATVAAFAYAQRLKREPLILDKVTFGHAFVTRTARVKHVTAFTPNGDCLADNGRIRFRVTRSDRANVQIVDPDGRLVRTLARDRFLKRYRFFDLPLGRPRPLRQARRRPGRYKLRVDLIGQDRALTPGGTLRLHLVEPKPNGCRRATRGAGRLSALAGAGVVVAAGAAAAAILLAPSRARSVAMLLALALFPVLILGDQWHSAAIADLRDTPARLARPGRRPRRS